MINKVILMGRLTADPELKQTQNGVAVCKINVAVNRPKIKDKEQEADFISVQAWRNTAEFISKYFSKGKMIIVEGSLRNNNYTDQNGVKHYSMVVQADSVAFGESKGNQQNNQQQPQAQMPYNYNNYQPQQNTYSQNVQPNYVQPQQYAGANYQQNFQQKLENQAIGNLSDFETLSDGKVPF
jgi:single-strand DNA-binding protein